MEVIAQYEYSPRVHTDYQIAKAVVAGNLNHQVSADWAIERFIIPNDGPFETIGTFVATEDITVYTVTINSIVWATIELRSDEIRNRVHASTEELAKLGMDEIRKLMPVKKNEDSVVRVTFVSMTRNGPSFMGRDIVVNRWADIEGNYPNAEEIAPLMSLSQSPSDGSLVVLSGTPGTGKTYAIRSMIYEMKDYMEFFFVVDPEQFFSDGSYLMQAIINSSSDFDMYTATKKKKKGKVFVFEDSGELLTVDAKQVVGQGLSRLLNVSDGVLGQGLELYFFVSTNEEIGRFHEAVTRNGRLHKSVVFKKHSASEGSSWLGTEVHEPHSLAELYAIRKGRTVTPVQRTGF